MIFYSCILFAVSAVCTVLAVFLMRGHENLVQESCREGITEKKAYAKSCSTIMWILAFTLLISGILPLVVAGKTGLLLSAGLLAVGFIAATVIFVTIQKKYTKRKK